MPRKPPEGGSKGKGRKPPARRRTARKPEPPPAPPPVERAPAPGGLTPAQIARLPRLEFMRHMLEQALLDVDAARSRPNGSTAVQQGTKFANALRAEIAEVEANSGGAAGSLRSLSDEELEDRVCAWILAADEALFDRILETCQQRLGGRPVLQLVDNQG